MFGERYDYNNSAYGALSAKSQIIPLLFATMYPPLWGGDPERTKPTTAATTTQPQTPNTTDDGDDGDTSSGVAPPSKRPRKRSSTITTPPPPRGCFVSLLPSTVLAECIGKTWVMRPERRVAVKFDALSVLAAYGNNDDPRYVYMFFSVSPTLGVVEEPRLVHMTGTCIGWLGGDSFMKRKTKDDVPDKSIVSLRFFGSTEYDFESDVVEATAIENTDSGNEILTVFHINLLNARTGSGDDPLKVIGKLNLSERGICTHSDCLTEPLVNRSDGTYCFLLRTATEIKLLVLNTGTIITLLPTQGHSSDISEPYLDLSTTFGIADESHVCLTNHSSAVTSIYPLSELLRVASSSSPPPLHPSPTPTFPSPCIQQMTPCQVHVFPPGSLVTSGCGILMSSSLHMRSGFHTVWFQVPTHDCRPDVLMTHQFRDATAGTTLFTITQFSKAQMPARIYAVPFLTPLENIRD
ncbi:hypothetical protein Pelo_15331 [Pelomyxa schiedti]|nr:hypothetical protein Pelo_15331 [Pelomyxa schiedti]